MNPDDIKRDYSMRYRYHVPTYRMEVKNVPQLLGILHGMQLDMIDEAVLKSDLSEADAVIKHIMEK